MTSLDERMREGLIEILGTTGPALYDAMARMRQRIAPDCEDTEGLDEQEKLLWLAMNPERERRANSGCQWIDENHYPQQSWHYRRKPAPKKPRVSNLVGGFNESAYRVPGVELTPEVEEALKKAGIEI